MISNIPLFVGLLLMFVSGLSRFCVVRARMKDFPRVGAIMT